MSNRGSASRRVSSGYLVAVAVLSLVLGHSAAAQGHPSSEPAKTNGRPASVTTGKRAAKPKAVRFSCPDAFDDGTLTDSRLADLLAAQANGLHWEGGYGLPDSCHREVRLVCGPDLDHDGDPEAIVQVGWWQALDGHTCASLQSSADYWPVSYTFLVTKHESAWRAVAPLAVGLFGDQRDLRRATDFVRLAKRELGILVSWSNVASESGCQIAGYEVFTFQAGTVRRVQTGDESPPCSSCCDRP